MKNKFNHSGLMIDNSRNAVMNVNTVKKMVDILENLGCNMLMLYTEDTKYEEGDIQTYDALGSLADGISGTTILVVAACVLLIIPKHKLNS